MALRSTPILRWSVFGGMTAILLGGLLLAFWPMVSADRALQAFCRDMPVGTPQADVRARAAAEGYAVAADGAASGVLVVDDPGGFGRRQCRLVLDLEGRVASAGR